MITLPDNYANMQPEDWKRWFFQYDRASIDEQGKVVTHANDMEEMYQMFMRRRDHEKGEAAKARMAMSKMEEAVE